MIYLIGNTELKTVKIGYARDKLGVIRRLEMFRTGNCCTLELITTVYGDRKEEHKFHREMRRYHKHGEWFYINEKNLCYWEDIFNYDFKEWYYGINYRTFMFEMQKRISL